MQVGELRGVALLALIPAGIAACATVVGVPIGILLIGLAIWIVWQGGKEDQAATDRRALERIQKEVADDARRHSQHPDILSKQRIPRPLPWQVAFRPTAGSGTGPHYDSAAYRAAWTVELRRFLRHPRNRTLSRELRGELRGALDYVWRDALARNEYLTPAMLLHRSRGLLVRQGHL